MVSPTMLPEMAFQHVNAIDVATGGASPMSDCQSPLDRWLGVPAKKAGQQSAPEHSFLLAPEGTTAANAYVTANQFQAPSVQMQQLHFPQMQANMQATMPAPVQQQQQPPLVYLWPAPAAPAWTAPQSNFGSWMDGYHGAHSCSTDVSDRALSSSSEDESPQEAAGEGQKLSASQARRKRRQRAAAFARAEKQQQLVLQYPGTSKLNLPSAAALSPELANSLTEQLKMGGEPMKAAFKSLQRSVRKFCFDNHGCRVLQLAIETGSHADVAVLLRELHGAVPRAAASPHGNYVLQKIIEIMPPAFSIFIAEELLGAAAETARHRFGCRILCRLLEHSSTERHTTQLVEEMLQEAGDLVRHEFGHHVMESILEHGLEVQKQTVVVALEQEMAQNVFNRSALFVLDRAMKQSTPGERSRLGAALRRTPETWVAREDPVLGMHIAGVMAHAV
eukprot:TRINITY_DN3369_c0_g1_i1.p1 TRINITY_DN3369_c0_g1~~TRINITY_DN3369_c0_g1_i1.p1  ORF type:complete len:448 (+),score=125.77 TRINITY_DN3369_c0_g1_i1:87-1430(+)